MEEHFFIFSIFICSIVLGTLLNNFFIKRPLKFLIKKANISAIRFSSQTKPIFGGITFFVVFLCLMIFGFFIFDVELITNPIFFAIAMVIILSFFMGLADDIISTPPIFKFVVQIICSVIFIFSGFYIHISPHDWINYLITLFWVLGIMNSINMLDNMDAITILISISILIGIITSFLIGINEISLLEVYFLIGILGAFLSFLFYNWNPAKMYMGDNGSQFIGAVLAFTGIAFFWNSVPIKELDYAYNTQQFVLIALAFVVPISDTATVTINRILRGKSPFVGGKDHTTHHLFYMGLSIKKVGLILLALNSIGITLAIYLISLPKALPIEKLWIFMAYPIIVFLFLFINTKISKQK